MQPVQLLYEGKAKKLYVTDNPDLIRVRYKDTATAFNGEKKAVLQGKGELNNRISEIFFHYLEQHGISTHFVQRISNLEQLVRKVEIIPVEVVVRNWVAGSMARRLGLAEGEPLAEPIVEFYYKNDELGDPLVLPAHLLLLKAATRAELEKIEHLALKINQLLVPFLADKGLILVDFKLEFGRTKDGDIVLADEISPDTCRLWDQKTKEKLDKDRFRRDLGDVLAGYREVLERLSE
jgi:phosphoribosylaminoimidazole-succinocarboxamide synthase